MSHAESQMGVRVYKLRAESSFSESVEREAK